MGKPVDYLSAGFFVVLVICFAKIIFKNLAAISGDFISGKLFARLQDPTNSCAPAMYN